MRRVAAGASVALIATSLAACSSNNIMEVTVGACMNSKDIPTGEASNVMLVECTDEHDMEAYASTTMPSASFPGVEEIKRQAEEYCYSQFESFIGKKYEESDLRIHYWTPTQTSWERSNDREILCVVQSPELLTGSMKGIAR